MLSWSDKCIEMSIKAFENFFSHPKLNALMFRIIIQPQNRIVTCR